MAERNGSWIVSVVKWVMERGYPEVTHCNSRYYRSESAAMDRLNAVIRSFEEQRYEIHPLDIPPNEEYKGVTAWSTDPKFQRVYATAYIDKNRS